MKIGSLNDLARMSKMPCDVMLRRLIAGHADFPVIARTAGRYVLDLDAAAAFVTTVWRDGRGGERREAARKATTIEALAAIPGMPSTRTIRKLIEAHPDFPVIARGGPGRPYEIDVPAASAFVRATWSDGRANRRHRRGQAHDRQPDLFNVEDHT